MSIYDEWKKKVKDNNSTYENWKKKVKEDSTLQNEDSLKLNNVNERNLKTQEQENKFISYNEAKKDAFKEREIEINQEKQRQKEAQEQINKEFQNKVNNINQNFNINNSQNMILPTANDKYNRNQNSINKSSSILQNAKLSKEELKPDYEYENKNKILTKGNFQDGYQFGDVTKTVLGTGADLVQDFSNGFMKPVENVIDVLANGGATVNNIKGNIAKIYGNENESKRLIGEADSLREFANKNLAERASKNVANASILGAAYNIVNGTPQRIFNPEEFEFDTSKNLGENIDRAYKNDKSNPEFEKSSILGGIADKVVNQIGYTAGQALTGKGLGSASNIPIKIGGKTLNVPPLAGIGGIAGGLEEANSKENISELERWTKAGFSGGIEGITEGLFGFFGIGGNELTDIAGKKVANKFSSSAGKTLAKLGFQGLGETTEEFLSYAGNYLADNGFINKLGKANFSSEWKAEEVGEEMALAFASTVISGGGASIFQNNYAVKEAEKQLGRKLTNQEKAQVVQTVIDEEFENIKKQELLTANTENIEPKTQTQQESNVLSVVNEKYNAVNQKRADEIIKSMPNFAEQIDQYIAKKYPSGDFLYLGKTPQILTKIGAPDNQIILKQSKLKTILEQSNNDTDKLHGIPVETIKKLPEAIANPLNILKSSTNENSIVIITDLADTNERPIIASIELNYDGQIGKIDFLSNRLTSAYGKNNYDRFMQKEIAKGNLLYDIDEGIIKELPTTRLQLPKGISSFDEASSINNSITSSKENVNSTNFTQNEQNYAPKFGETDIAERARKVKQIDITPIKNTPGENINWNEIEKSEGKFRKHYRSIIESSKTTAEAKAIAKELMGLDTYEADSNASQLERADTYIEKYGIEKALERLQDHVKNDSVSYDGIFRKVGVDDIALGERLIQYYSKTGDAINLQNAIRLTATAGTDAGRMVQAFNILNHQTPTGQVAWIQRSVDKMNKELQQKRNKNTEQFDFTPEMQQKILNAETQEEMYKAIDEVYQELGRQVTKTLAGKIDSWRYFSMLANPRTHIRNIAGNIAMGKVQTVKNKIAGLIEGTVAKINPEMERTHTIVPASKEVKEFAKNDLINIEVQTGLELNENKYNPKSRLENSMRTFKHDAFENTLGGLFNINNKALEAEDAWGLKSAYVKSLSEYMTANKLTPETITDSQLAKARKYAIEQAKEATFHQASALATVLNQFSNKNGMTKFIADAVIPYKKTPINVAKAGLEYSPVGLARSVIYDTAQLRRKNITVNKYIDNISKGLTGTGITLLGYALAEAGILKAGGGDDKDKENYDKDRGQQTYSITIGDNTYSLDWLAPTGIPLFIGAEIHENMQQSRETKKSSSDDDKTYDRALVSVMNIFNSFTNAVDPMTEMSMLSGLSSTIKSYDDNLFAGMAVNAGKSYMNQFVPTALGQVAKVTDDYERSTTSTKTGTLPKAIDSTKNQIMAKIPGLRQQLPIKTDIWGNDQKQSENVLQKGLENAVFPWTRKELTSNNVDKKLNTLYKNTGESSVLPDNINKNLTIDKQKYEMTSSEYAKYKKQYGQDSYKLLNGLVSSSDYKKMSDSQKQTAIEKIYDYAKEQIKIDYAKNNKLNYKESKLSSTVNTLKKSNANTSNYFEYMALTQDMKKDNEKIKSLVDSNYSNKTKQIIYENNLLSNDKRYNIIKASGMNINEYLKYKLQAFESDKEDDGTIKGKSISGSKKNKQFDYIMNMNITGVQKQILWGLDYTPTQQNKQTIINYIITLPGKTKQQKLDMLSQFSWIKIYRDGTYGY